MQKRGKKGALELSMNTIVVIVIGVVMLTLGLTFVRNLIGGQITNVGELNQQTRNQIAQLFEQSTDKVFVTKTQVDLKKGESTTIGLGIRNDQTAQLGCSYLIQLNKGGLQTQLQSALSAPGSGGIDIPNSWLVNKQKSDITLKSGDKKDFGIGILVPESAIVGFYPFSIDVTCNAQPYDTAEFFVNVQPK